jgi:glycosyltransferase involved in cell wall biosynthesis
MRAKQLEQRSGADAPPLAQATGRPSPRLAVVTTHPIQYQCPLWRQLAARTELSAVKVFFASDFSTRGYMDRGFGQRVCWDGAMLSGYVHESFGKAVIDSRSYLGTRSMIRSIIHFRPDACLLNAYLPLMYVRILAACNAHRIPVVLRAEATDRDQVRSSLKATLRDTVLRRLYARIGAFSAIGTNAEEHYLRLGVPPSRIGRSPYCIDSELFDRLRGSAVRGSFRASLRVHANAFVVLFSGKLIPKKDPLLLLDALRGIEQLEGRPLHVWFLGDGELRTEIERRAASWIHGRVRVLGFLPQESLGEVYADSDMLVLPSATRETWGLVVNEALEFGLPCVVSDRVGCARDLVEPGATGMVFAAGDAQALRARIAELALACAERGTAISEACRAKAREYSSHAAVEGIVRCVLDVTARRRSASETMESKSC